MTGRSSALPSARARYRPFAQIGRGGTAEVMLAEMEVGAGLRRLAVLKRVWPDLAGDAELLSLFVEEARLGVRMNHPNVIQTYELLEEPEQPVLAQEYLDGQPLTRVLNRLVDSNTLTLTLRLRIVGSILAALDYAHDLTDYDGTPNGVLHGDVNPQSVIITYDGQVKLVDFGAGTGASGAHQQRRAFGRVQTRARMACAYMAPEQVEGGIVDLRADLFAVGVMLWEMATGRRLWQGMDEATIIRQLSSRMPIPPIGLQSQLPKGLDRICGRALARDPASRYDSAAEFAADIARLLPGRDDGLGRHLGKVVSIAFAEERQARRSLVEAHMKRRELHAPDGSAQVTGFIAPSRATPGAMWTVHGLADEEMDIATEVTIQAPEDEADGEPTLIRGATRDHIPPAHLPTTKIHWKPTARLRWAATGFLCASAIAAVAAILGGAGTWDRTTWWDTPKKLAAAWTRSISAPASRPTAGAAASVPEAVPVAPVVPATHAFVTPMVVASAPEAAPAVRERRKRGRRSPSRASQEHANSETVRVHAPAATSDDEDDVLQPSFDLSTPPTIKTLPEPVPEVPGSHPTTPRLARRLTARPLDTSDPYQP